MYIAMSTELPSIAEGKLNYPARVTIVASTYNERYTSALLENCLAELRDYSDRININIVRVPGAYEVPLMVKRAIVKPANGEQPDAVIALGVILRGSTAHADLIGEAITRQLLSISCDTLLPVIHEDYTHIIETDVPLQCQHIKHWLAKFPRFFVVGDD